ncbi:hypothetical protein ACZ90_54120 [Streptomyces albus subsp. albus]|nr:hypothetical protein ACZ90_54120 [Streptomyces albus subsp. albus]
MAILMRLRTVLAGAALAAVTIAGLPAAAQAAQTEPQWTVTQTPQEPVYRFTGDHLRIQSWACPDGVTCLFQSQGGTGWMWPVEHCGFNTLPVDMRDKVSSVWNRGGGSADLYDAAYDMRDYLATVPQGAQANLRWEHNDRTSSVYVNC